MLHRFTPYYPNPPDPDIPLWDCEDCNIRSRYKDNVYNGEYLGWGSRPTWGESRALIRFDEPVGDPELITGGTMKHNWGLIHNYTGEPYKHLAFYRITQDWDETTTTWNTRPSTSQNPLHTYYIRIPPEPTGSPYYFEMSGDAVRAAFAHGIMIQAYPEAWIGECFVETRSKEFDLKYNKTIRPRIYITVD